MPAPSDLDTFADRAAARFVYREPRPYPDDTFQAGIIDGVSSVAVENAVTLGELARAEADVIYDKLDR